MTNTTDREEQIKEIVTWILDESGTLDRLETEELGIYCLPIFDLIQQREAEAVEKVLNDFSEYCHGHYLGATLENDTWFYHYDSEVVILKDKYLDRLAEGNEQSQEDTHA